MTVSGIDNSERDVQPSKQFAQIFDSPDGRLTCFNDGHSLNTELFNIVIDSGTVISVSELQFLNADMPISVTDEGMAKSANAWQLLKA